MSENNPFPVPARLVRSLRGEQSEKRLFQIEGPRPYRETSWVAVVWDIGGSDGPRREVLAHLCDRDEAVVRSMLVAVALKLLHAGWGWRDSQKEGS